MRMLRLLVAGFIFIALGKLQLRWSLYQEEEVYAVFTLLLVFVILFGLWTNRQQIIKAAGRRLWPIIPIFLLCLPWGEFFRLNLPASREDWSRQILHQTIYLYVLFTLLPQSFRFQNWVTSLLNRIAFRGKFLYVPAVAFFLLSVAISYYVFGRLPMIQDTSAYLFQARTFFHGSLTAPSPPAPEFFDTPGDMLILHNKHWVSMYQPGFAILLCLAMFFKGEWILPSLLGALTVGIWILYGARWYGRSTASFLGMMMLFSPFLLLMFSSPMIHAPELALTSAIIYLCRHNMEKSSFLSLLLLFLLIPLAVITRGFSIFVFLAPILIYSTVHGIRHRRFALLLTFSLGIVIGISMILIYQWKVYGNALITGYELEYPSIRYGFGESLNRTHTPLGALEQLSNNLLAMNHWLTGWYSGSLFFLIAFFLFFKFFDLWDRILILCCISLAAFYFGYLAPTNLVFGPRFYFLMAPVLLFFLARFITSTILPESLRPIPTALILTFLVSLPVAVPRLIFGFKDGNVQRKAITEYVKEQATEKKLIFLTEEVDRTLINMNDPFLRQNWILCLDLGARNQKVIQLFPQYTPAYFFGEIDFHPEEEMGAGYQIKSSRPDRNRQLSLFELTLAIQGLSDQPAVDVFEMAYQSRLFSGSSRKQLEFIQEKMNCCSSTDPYKDGMRKGLLSTAFLLLESRRAFEEHAEDWPRHIRVGLLRHHLSEAEIRFSEAGEIGKVLNQQIVKVKRRADKNRDNMVSEQELIRFLRPRVELLYLN